MKDDDIKIEIPDTGLCEIDRGNVGIDVLATDDYILIGIFYRYEKEWYALSWDTSQPFAMKIDL